MQLLPVHWGGMLGTFISGDELRDMLGPITYLLVREGTPVYIGSSDVGLSRPLAGEHLRHRMVESDTLVTIPCSTLGLARNLERNLIRILRPTWNKQHNTDRKRTPAPDPVRAAAVRAAALIRKEKYETYLETRRAKHNRY